MLLWFITPALIVPAYGNWPVLSIAQYSISGLVPAKVLAMDQVACTEFCLNEESCVALSVSSCLQCCIFDTDSFRNKSFTIRHNPTYFTQFKKAIAVLPHAISDIPAVHKFSFAACSASAGLYDNKCYQLDFESLSACPRPLLHTNPFSTGWVLARVIEPAAHKTRLINPPKRCLDQKGESGNAFDFDCGPFLGCPGSLCKNATIVSIYGVKMWNCCCTDKTRCCAYPNGPCCTSSDGTSLSCFTDAQPICQKSGTCCPAHASKECAASAYCCPEYKTCCGANGSCCNQFETCVEEKADTDRCARHYCKTLATPITLTESSRHPDHVLMDIVK